MIRLKTDQEIEIMKEGGRILASVLDNVIEIVKPGIGTEELTDLAEKLIVEAGGKPSFKGYKAAWAEYAYPSALCVSINDEVVHGLPVPNRIIKEGDIVGLDCGLEYKGYFTDMARTVAVGKVYQKIKKLITVTEEALYKGIKAIKPGRHVSDISLAIQNHVEKNGFSVVRQLVGHGVGHSAHEEPQIPNYIDKGFSDIKLEKGMCLALEPMVNIGDWPVETMDDDWTIKTVDNSISAHFEHTVVVTDNGVEIVTKK
jgi:methionyl aminopeptidase